MARDYPSSIPLHWDEKPGTPRRRSNGKDEAGSFLMTSDFEFSARFAELDDPSMSPTPMSSANELFCNGQIKPLKIPTRIENASCSTSRINIEEHVTSRINITEHATSAVTALPNAFEFHTRGALNSSISVPHSPRFSSTFDCVGASACGIYEVNKGRSASSLSAPQSPRSPINRVKGALCGVSPSRIDRACDTSIHMPIEVSRHALQSSNRINKPFDASMHMSLEGSRHSLESSRHAREGSRRSERSMLSLALGSQAAGHRRSRSFSPLRIFQRGEHRSSSSSIGAMQQEDTTHTLSRDSSASEKKHDDDFNSAPKSLHKKWTLKDLLHRKSGGENRSNSSRASSRRSGASADSTSTMSGKSLSAGRSSSESTHSSISSCNTYTKEVSTSKVGSRGRMESMNKENNANGMGKKGVKQGMCDGKDNNKNNKGNYMCKAKSSSQRGGVQKGNSNKGCVSPHEMHYMMQKAQSEELRKRTFLPYRQGLLGCLGFTSRSYRTVSSLSKTLQSVSG